MALLDINWSPDKKQLRFFLILLVIFSFVISGIVYHRTESLTAVKWVLGIGLGLAVLGFAIPAVGRYTYVVWMVAAFPIGWTISHLVLAAVYYLLITPIGLFMRLIGRDPIGRTFDQQQQSYWHTRKKQDDLTRYFRQF